MVPIIDFLSNLILKESYKTILIDVMLAMFLMDRVKNGAWLRGAHQLFVLCKRKLDRSLTMKKRQMRTLTISGATIL